MKRFSRKAVPHILWLCLLVSGLFFLQGSGADVKAGTDEVYQNIEVFAEVLRQIEENFVYPLAP